MPLLLASRRSIGGVVFRLGMPLFFGLLLLVAQSPPGRAQTVPPVLTTSGLGAGASGIGNLIEGVIVREAAQVGATLSISGPAIDAAMGTALTTLEGEAVTAAGVAAVGNPVTWAGIGAFSAGMAVAGTTYCLTNGCDVSAVCKTNLTCVSSTIWTALATMLGSISNPNGWVVGTTPLTGGPWCASASGPFVCASNPSDAAIGAMVNLFGSSHVSGCTPTSSGATCYISNLSSNLSISASQWANVTQAAGTSGSFQSKGEYYPVTSTGGAGYGTLNPNTGVSISSQDGYTPNGGSIFNIGNGSSGGSSSPGGITSSQLGEEASASDIAAIANAVNKLASSSLYGSANPPDTITPQEVRTVEAELNILPTLSDLLSPVAAGDLITTNSGGAAVPSQSVTTSLSTISGAISPTIAALNQAAPCGNILAGETPCGETLDFVYNPLTGSYEWMSESREISSLTNQGSSLAPYANTSVLQQLQTAIVSNLASKQDQQTATITATQVDPLTDVQTATQDITATESPTAEKLADPVSLPSPAPWSSLPPLTLPFDEWPQVINSFNTNFPSITGVCPTVSFTSSVLQNTTFTIASQCIVMNSLQPYMAYVLPPTYLLMALLLIMSA